MFFSIGVSPDLPFRRGCGRKDRLGETEGEEIMQARADDVLNLRTGSRDGGRANLRAGKGRTISRTGD